jgi:hypothetical protein
MHMCPHPLWCWCMGQNINNVSSIVLGLGVLKLFITLNSYDWLRVHSMLDSINIVHQSSSNVCDPLYWISNFCTWASALFDAHFGAKIGLCENFTLLNFQPFVFFELWQLVHCQCTSIPSVGNKIIYTILYSLNLVGNHNKIFYFT